MRILWFLAALLWGAAAQAQAPLPPLFSGAPGWVMQAASTGVVAAVDLDMANQRFWPWNALGQIAVNRASPAEASGPDGTWHAFANNQLPITASGAESEEARTNSIRDNTMVGAVVGTPGTAPNNWTLSQIGSGISESISAITTVNGINTIDIAFAGTSSGTITNTTFLFFETTTTIAATYGQTWSGFEFLGIPVGSQGTATISSLIAGSTSGGATVAAFATAVSPGASLSRLGGSATLTGSTTAFVNEVMQFSVGSGVAVSFTLRIGWPQLENNSLINSSVASATVAGGGTGYVGAGTMTWSGPNCATPPVLNVTESGGIINAVTSVAVAGSCTVFPPAGATTWTDGGGLSVGTGATFNLVPTNNAANACATSPILTTSAAAARAATVATLALPPGAAPTSGYSLVGIGTPECPTGYPGNQFIGQIDDGTSSNRIYAMRAFPVGPPVSAEAIGNVGTYATPSLTWSQNTPGKLTTFATNNSIKSAFNSGATASGSPSGLAAGLTTLRIGTQSSGLFQWNGYISRLTVLPANALAN